MGAKVRGEESANLLFRLSPLVHVRFAKKTV